MKQSAESATSDQPICRVTRRFEGTATAQTMIINLIRAHTGE